MQQIAPDVSLPADSYSKLIAGFLHKRPQQIKNSKDDDLSFAAHTLDLYLNQTSCYSIAKYVLFLSSTPTLESAEDKIIRTILKQINLGFITSHEEEV